MTTFVQSVANASAMATVSPLHAAGSAPTVWLSATSVTAIPSSITTFGATPATDPLTYDAASLLQSFAPTFSVSGLTAAQQQQLALDLGLNAKATSAELTNAINALLTPSNPDNSLVDVLVGGLTKESSSTTPSLLDIHGEISGVPVSSTNQAINATYNTLLNLVTAPATINTAATSAATSTTPTTSNTPTTPTTNTVTASSSFAQTAVANISVAGTSQLTGVPAAASAVASNPIIVSSPQSNSKMATTVSLTNIAANVITVGNATVTPLPAASGAGGGATNTLTSQIATAETGIAENNATTATVSTTITATPNLTSNAATILTTFAIPSAASTATAVLADNAYAASQLAESAQLAFESSLTTGLAVAQATPVAQAPPTVIPVAPAVSTIASTTLAGGVVNNRAPVSPATSSAAQANNSVPVAFSNADNVLQSLLADATSHALIAVNQAAATYAVPGVSYQLSSGVDHTRQADLKGKLFDIRDTLTPVSRIAASRGALDRQT